MRVKISKFTLKLPLLNALAATECTVLLDLKADTAFEAKVGFPNLFMRKDIVDLFNKNSGLI